MSMLPIPFVLQRLLTIVFSLFSSSPGPLRCDSPTLLSVLGFYIMAWLDQALTFFFLPRTPCFGYGQTFYTFFLLKINLD